MTAILLLIAAVLLGLSALGMVWIRATATEYRHRWSVPSQATRGAYRQR